MALLADAGRAGDAVPRGPRRRASAPGLGSGLRRGRWRARAGWSGRTTTRPRWCRSTGPSRAPPSGCAGLRIGRTGVVIESLVPAILEQKVIGSRRGGPGRPGPAPRRGRPGAARHAPAAVARDAGGAALLRVPPVRRRAASRRPDPARSPRRRARLEGLADAASPAARRYARAALRALPGIGPWTAAEVGIRAFGDPDAVSVGDFHLPSWSSWALAGEPRGTDERMLELLEPYRGQRGACCACWS